MREALEMALDALLIYGAQAPAVRQTITAIKEALAQPEQKPLAKVEPCAVCGEGKARLSVLRSCDTCHSEYAGQAEMKVALAQPDYRAVKTYHEGKPVYVSQPEQEPVARVINKGPKIRHYAKLTETGELLADGTQLYTALPKRPWVGLTDDEIDLAWPSPAGTNSIRAVAKAIEAKLKEKNT